MGFVSALLYALLMYGLPVAEAIYNDRSPGVILLPQQLQCSVRRHGIGRHQCVLRYGSSIPGRLNRLYVHRY